MSSFLSFNKDIYYSFYPRVFRVGEESELRLFDRFGRRDLPNECIVQIVPVSEFKKHEPFVEIAVTSKDGELSFLYTFDYEQQYLIRLLTSDRQNLFIEFAVYALEDDLFELRPYKGDLHLHTNRSDGMETPEHMLCACRERGLDFFAITDHNRFEPSLEAIAALEKVPNRMVAFKGEEVHAGCDDPREALCPVHILSLDADYAISPFTSFQTDESYETAVATLDADFDHLAAEKPWLGAMGKETALQMLSETKERREELLSEFEDSTQRINPESYVYALDVFEKIKKAQGFSVLCHTQWKFIPQDGFVQRDDAPIELTKKLIKEKPFDVYEAASYAPKEEAGRNLMQLKLLAEAGHLGSTPLIGITDSHTTMTDWNELGKIFTIVFVEDFSTRGIREAILDNRCVAVEHYEGEDARCHGSFRLSVFAEFLIDQYYASRDERSKFESALMYRSFEDKEDESPNQTSHLLKELCELNQKEDEKWWA